MVIYMARKIKEAHDEQGLLTAQNIYRTLFVTTQFYAMYKADVDMVLVTDGYGDCVVTE